MVLNRKDNNVKKFYENVMYTKAQRGRMKQDAEKGYEQRFTCKPNCNDKDGGPPIFSAIVLVLIWVYFFQYNTGKNTRQVFEDLTNSPYSVVGKKSISTNSKSSQKKLISVF